MIALLAQAAFGCFAVYGALKTAHFGYGFWRVWALERELERERQRDEAWAEMRLARWAKNEAAANAMIDEVTASVHDNQTEAA